MFVTRTFACALLVAASSLVAACSGGTVHVGSTHEQELRKKSDGGATGDGATCSFDDPVSSDGESGPTSGGPYAVGDTFPSPDGCNQCTCTRDGIACTLRACAPDPGQACSEEAKLCPDGKTYVGRTGPSCAFAPYPDETICPQDAIECPDGTEVGRTGPDCEFVCP